MRQRIFGSLAVGPGVQAGVAGGAPAAALGAWYAPGRFVVGYRTAGVERLFGEGRLDKSFLAGISNNGDRLFGFGAVGIAGARSFTTCDDCGRGRRDPTTIALAFQAEAEANLYAAGLGVDVFGAVGARRVSYVAIGLSVQLGAFPW
jgi:hypothetical protein